MYGIDSTLISITPVKKGNSNITIGYVKGPLTLIQGIDTFGYSTQNGLYLNMEYFLRDRVSFNVFGSFILGKSNFSNSQYFLDSNYVNDQTYIPSKITKYTYGLGIKYYPSWFEYNGDAMPIAFKIPLSVGFQQTYINSEFKQNGFKDKYIDNSFLYGIGLDFFQKNIYGVSASRFIFSFNYSSSLFYVGDPKILKGDLPHRVRRRENNTILSLGVKYRLNKPDEYMVKQWPKYHSFFNDYYSKNSLFVNYLPYFKIHENAIDIGSGLEGEYFLRKRFSMALGYCGVRTINGNDDYIDYSENKINLLLSVYPKLMRGNNVLSVSARTGLSFLWVDHIKPIDINNKQDNFGFNSLVWIVGTSVTITPHKVFSNSNRRLSLILGYLGSITHIKNTTTFRYGDNFKPFGYGDFRGSFGIRYKLF